jgi:hypothetical protein
MQRFFSIVVLSGFLAAAAVPAKGQEYFTMITYDMSLPMGDFKDGFIGDTSFRGWTLEGRWFTNEQVSFGLSFGWNIFHEKTSELSSFRVTDQLLGDVTGRQFSYVNSFPFLVNSHFYLGDEYGPRPYAGLGLGVSYTVQRFELGVWQRSENNFHFTLAPEVGFLVPISYSTSAVLAARYNHAFKAGDYVTREKFDIQYLSFIVGFAFSPDF